MIKKLTFLVVATVIFWGFAPSSQAALDTSTFIQGFDINPKTVTQAQSSNQQLSYSFKLVGTESDVRAVNECSGYDTLHWDIFSSEKGDFLDEGDIPISKFLLGSVPISGSKAYAFNQDASITSTDFQLDVRCGSQAPFAQSSPVTISITGYATNAITDFHFNVSPTVAQPGSNTPFSFSEDATANNAKLVNSCNGASDLVLVRVYLLKQGDDLTIPPDPAQSIFAFKPHSVSEYATGKKISEQSNSTLAVPNGDFKFEAVITCNNDKKQLSSSSPIVVSAGGAASPNSGYNNQATASHTYNFNITNPLGTNGPNTLFDVIDVVTQWMLNISIPLAVLGILYAGFLYLTAGPKPGQVDKAKKILINIVIGLAIIFIGRGFITLIQSVITSGLGGSSANQSQTQTQSQSQSQAPANATVGKLPGGSCSDSTTCKQGLVCAPNGICQYPQGNGLGGYACVDGSNCASGLVCDTSDTGAQTIDGKQLGTCSQPSGQ